jgi:BirA family biotin operon repressor/biotin-[acetyl-CoA-carboxylase] ligase
MIEHDSLGRAGRTLPPPFSLLALDRTDSTNDEARRAAQQGAGHGFVVCAVEQTAGRGRRGRGWVSAPGNLFCSVLLDPGSSPAEAPQLAFVAAVALAKTLNELLPSAGFQVKWPNDILCQGRKVSGMLLELALPWAILGVGVNIAHAPDLGLYPATCLASLGSDTQPFDVLTGFCGQLAEWYAVWRTVGFAAVRQAWLDLAYGVGGPVTVRLSDEKTLQGRFTGLDEGGALLLETADGRRQTVLAGDAFFSRDK